MEIGRAATGKAIIVLNPAEPPILMRNTVYCALAAGADCVYVVDSAGAMTTAVSEKQGYATGINLPAIMDVAEDVVAPIMPRPQVVDRDGLTLGYAGVYSSFLLHAQRASAQFGVATRDILLELGRRRIIGGQEDMIMDVAMELSRKRG